MPNFTVGNIVVKTGLFHQRVRKTNPTFHCEDEVSPAASWSHFFTWRHGSCRAHRTGALWAAGSLSARWLDPPSSQCYPAGAGPTPGHTLLQTTGDTKGQRLSFCFHKAGGPPGCRTESCIYLAVCKLAVLQVAFTVKGPDTGVGVVVGVFAHAVWKTLLEKICWVSAAAKNFYLF